MANYIGNIPSQGEFKKLDSIASSFDGNETQFNLNYNSVSQPVGDASQLIVSLNGVIQEPLTSYTLGIGGSTIVFSSAPQSGDTCHIVLIGGVGGTATPSDNSVTAEKIVDDSVVESKIADGAVTTSKIADDQITNAKIAPDAVTSTEIADGSVTYDQIADDTIITSKIADGQITSAKIASGAVEGAMTTQIGGRRNLIINGAMQVAQRGTSFTNYTGYTVDRWFIANPGTNSITNLFDSTLGMDYVAVTASFNFGAVQKLENKDVRRFSDGTQLTLSYWSKENTGIAAFGVDGGAVRAILMTTIETKGSWYRRSVTFSVNSTEATAFQGSSNAYIEVRPETNTWTFTGVQLEVGTVATPFEHRSYGEELALCQRYYYASELTSTWFIDAYLTAGTYCLQAVPFPTTMRTRPTTTADMSTNWIKSNVISTQISPCNKNHANWEIRASSGGRTYMYYNANDGATIKFDAEL